MSQILMRAKSVFEKVFDEENLNLTRETTASDVNGWDSLAHLQLILGLEREFKIRFRTSEIVEAKNVGELLDLIELKLKCAVV